MKKLEYVYKVKQGEELLIIKFGNSIEELCKKLNMENDVIWKTLIKKGIINVDKYTITLEKVSDIIENYWQNKESLNNEYFE